MVSKRNRLKLSKLLGISAIVLLFSCEKGGNAGASAGNGDAVNSTLLLCKPAEYDLGCMKDDKTSTSDDLLDVLGGLKKDVVDAAGGEISPKRQDEYGESSRKEIEAQFPVMPNHPKTVFLEGLMRKLLALREEPSGIGFHIFVVNSEMVNAFTLGGEIYVTNSLLDQAESTDELACIIGHEIGHNELGHVAEKLKEVELAQGIFGNEAGAAIAGVVGLVTMGFNQRNEAEADLYGIDLALAAGYNACRGIDFWDRMQSQEGEANDMENFFRSHPYSTRRAYCYRSHLSSIHKVACDK